MKKIVRLFLLVCLLASVAGISAGTARADVGHVLTIDDLSMAEGNSGAISAVLVTVHVDPTPELGERVKVDFGTSAIGGTATTSAPGDATPTFPEDFAQTDGTLSFEATETSHVVAIPVREDFAHESDESFFVKLFNARGECVVPGTCTTGATIGDNKATVTLTNDDAEPALSVDDVTHDEGDADTTTYSFTVTKTNSSAEDVTVHVATADDSAAAPDDYTSKTADLTFPASDGLLPETQTFDVAVNGDEDFEADEAFKVMLSNAMNATVSDAEGVGTITNDDPTPPPTMSVDDAAGAEGGTVDFVVKLASPPGPGQTALVDWALAGSESDGSATPGVDFTLASGSLVYTAGEDEQTISATTIPDVVDELDETFTLQLTQPESSGTGGYVYAMGDGSATGTISDDDAEPELTIGDISLEPEGTSTSTAVATFTVTKTGATDRDVTVDFETADGSAIAEDDYVAKSGTLTFAPEETSKEVSVEVVRDDLNEADETFSVELSNPGNATIAGASGVATIVDDDAVAATLSIADVNVTEGNTGTTTASFTVTKAGPSGQVATVGYATSDGSAKAGSDHVQKSGVLSFAPGETTKSIVVDVKGDALNEGNEWYLVNLSNAANASILDEKAFGGILNDDAAPRISIGTDSVNEDPTKACTFLVKLSAPSGRQVTLNYATVSGTATTADYVAKSGTVTFVPGDVSEQIKIFAKGDSKDEPTEKFFVKLSGISPSGSATFTNSTGTCSIIDND